MDGLKEPIINGRLDGLIRPRPLRCLRALVLLAGAMRRSALVAAIGRPVFDLPLRRGWSILDQWQREAQALAALLDDAVLPVRVAVDREVRLSRRQGRADDPSAPISLQRDAHEYRGAGGVVRDLAVEYADDDYVLVASAAQVLQRPLHELAVALAGTGGDVAAVVHRDGTPSSLFLLRCGAIRQLPAVGFVDLKEQALMPLSRQHDVRAIELPSPCAVPLCTLADYIQAVRWHQAGPEDPAQANPYAETHNHGFAIVEEGAAVDPSAILHDSIVLEGGHAEAESAAVRSLVCPGGTLRRGELAVERLIVDPHARRRHRS